MKQNKVAQMAGYPAPPTPAKSKGGIRRVVFEFAKNGATAKVDRDHSSGEPYIMDSDKPMVFADSLTAAQYLHECMGGKGKLSCGSSAPKK